MPCWGGSLVPKICSACSCGIRTSFPLYITPLWCDAVQFLTRLTKLHAVCSWIGMILHCHENLESHSSFLDDEGREAVWNIQLMIWIDMLGHMKIFVQLLIAVVVDSYCLTVCPCPCVTDDTWIWSLTWTGMCVFTMVPALLPTIALSKGYHSPFSWDYRSVVFRRKKTCYTVSCGILVKSHNVCPNLSNSQC